MFVFCVLTEDVMMATNTRELVNKTKVKTKLHQHTVTTKLRTRLNLNVVSMPKSQFQTHSSLYPGTRVSTLVHMHVHGHGHMYVHARERR